MMHDAAFPRLSAFTVFFVILTGLAMVGGCDCDTAGHPSKEASPSFPPCRMATASPGTLIHLDPSDSGRVFDGVGAISSAGNSRYLIDYPEPQRSQVLDYLFKPGYGAALQILKVEIGGDMNSTCGADASHMHDRNDLDCTRSYQWWMMEEAKARNPEIKLAGLAWGAPGWLGGHNFWSQDTIDYLMAWLECGRSHGLTIDYLGGLNESVWDRGWYLALKAALTAHGYPTKLVAAETHATFGWLFPVVLAFDPKFADAVDAVSVHYPCNESSDTTSCISPRRAQALGRPLWAGEEGGSPEDWARVFTHGYIDGRMTAFINWPLMASLPEGMEFQGAGLIVANQPWSGTYHVNPQVWVFAHTTQFTRPGWHYLDGAVGYLAANRSQGSYVTMVSPDGSDFSVIIETTPAREDQVVELTFAETVPQKTFHVWVSDMSSQDDSDYLVHTCDIEPDYAPIRLTLAPRHLFTLTTTTGQGHGKDVGPEPSPFPLPYQNDFDDEPPGREARLLASQNGAFDVVACGGDRSGRCVRQMASEMPIFWGPQYSNPFALVGDASLADYTIRVDVMPEKACVIEILGRYNNQVAFQHLLCDAYTLSISTHGDWAINRYDHVSDWAAVLASGKIERWPIGTWRTISLTLHGSTIRATIDGTDLATVTDSTYSFGLAGIGLRGLLPYGGWFNVQFDNLSITADDVTTSPQLVESR